AIPPCRIYKGHKARFIYEGCARKDEIPLFRDGEEGVRVCDIDARNSRPPHTRLLMFGDLDAKVRCVLPKIIALDEILVRHHDPIPPLRIEGTPMALQRVNQPRYPSLVNSTEEAGEEAARPERVKQVEDCEPQHGKTDRRLPGFFDQPCQQDI